MQEQDQGSPNKSFLIVDRLPDQDLISVLEREVALFAVHHFGKDILDKTEIKIDIDFESGELKIDLLFKEFEYICQVRGKQLQCFSLYLTDQGYQVFCDNGSFFSKVVYQWDVGSEFQADVKEVYGLRTRGLYDKFTDFILTC
ncbi:hypothetical protein [Desulfosporosinus sp.]|uniref:hypothetical protein n=1 Tax=Desulfosporosinus sp. TaxID=157907 RepID=UPI0025BA55C8|nr:hypothetical protein [Desulfosporosinus sp.]MBC2724510.1 hypothetical protein [Desulfosporosinus sp.]MBC2727382.1 hypothetical protein [Desulfosporosinus sp.]